MDCLTDSEKNYLLHLLLSCDTKPDFNYATVMQTTGMGSVGGARNKLPLILKKLKKERQMTAAWEKDGAASASTSVGASAAAGTAAGTSTGQKRKAGGKDKAGDSAAPAAVEEEDAPAPKRAKKTKGAE